MRTRCRTRPSSRRTGRTTSRASTSCAPCAASTPACPAACTCTWGTAAPCRRCTRRCSAPTMADAPARLADAAVRERLTGLDELLERVEQIPGPAGELALEAVSALAEIYGEALARA